MPHTLFLSVVENFPSEAPFILKVLFVFIIFDLLLLTPFPFSLVPVLRSHMYVASSKSDYFVAFVLKCIRNFYFFDENSVKQTLESPSVAVIGHIIVMVS